MNNTNAEVGQRIQEKFQFYVLGLIFALLGLAIQTAEFGVSAVADIMELAGWIALLVSALVLMSRLEWIPQIYHLFDVQQEIEDQQRQLREAKATGVSIVDPNRLPLDTEAILKRLDEKISLANSQIAKIEKGSTWKYLVHRYGFLLDLVLLMGARGYLPFVQLIQRLCGP